MLVDKQQRVMATALPSERYQVTQEDTRTETRQCYFSYFPKPWLGQGLQFQPLLWFKKSALSNYTMLAQDDVKMITVSCTFFRPHQSEGPEPTRTCPTQKNSSILFQDTDLDKYTLAYKSIIWPGQTMTTFNAYSNKCSNWLTRKFARMP